MINFLYTHTYYDSTQAGPDDISLLEADSQREVEPQVQNPQQTELQSQTQTLPEIEDDIEFEDDISDATALKSLLFHVRMNSIADYYDIPELRQCASTEAQNILNTSWSPCNFPIIIQEAVKSTGDKELRNILSDAMAAHMDELVELGEDIAPPELISDFAFSVIRRLVAEKQQKLESMNKFKALLSKTSRCHHCCFEFRCTIVEVGTYNLSCTQCGMHYAKLITGIVGENQGTVPIPQRT